MKKFFLYLMGILCVFPAVIVLLRSFMSPEELLQEFHLIPQKWTLINYDVLLLTDVEYYQCFWNSVKYTLGILLFGLPVSLFAGYAFSCRKFRSKKVMFVIYIVIMLIPFQATLVPQYLMLNHMGLLNTGYAVVLPNIFAALGAILITQFMSGIDQSLYEAGKLDGLGHFTMFTKLVIPLCKPVIWSYLVLTFIDCWAMIEQPMVFFKDMEFYPLALAMESYEISRLLPGSVIFSILPLLIFLFSRQSLVNGIKLSVLK